jgi:hypothetical protein
MDNPFDVAALKMHYANLAYSYDSPKGDWSHVLDKMVEEGALLIRERRGKRQYTTRAIEDKAAKYSALAGRIMRAETDQEVLAAMLDARFLSEQASCYRLAGAFGAFDLGNKATQFASLSPEWQAKADLFRKMYRDRSLPDYLVTVLDIMQFDWQIPPDWHVSLEYGCSSCGEGGYDSLEAALAKVEEIKLRPRNRVEGRERETIVVTKMRLVNHHGGYDGSPEMKTEKVGRWERRSFKAGWKQAEASNRTMREVV